MSIASITRRMIRSASWGWRHARQATPQEERAAEILRGDYRKAALWLGRVSDLAGMPLPVGNGTNGSWHRLACVTPAGRFGVVDIAAGRAVEYDAACPPYVLRFACEAGGRGGWR